MLSKICTEYGISSEITNWDIYRRLSPAKDLLQASAELYRLSGFDTIVIGGHTILPQLLGYREMRKRSGDIDSVGTETGIRLLILSRNCYTDMHYGISEDELFLEKDGMPLGVSLNKIHDWQVPLHFRESSIVFEVPEIGPIRVGAPEYQITLKLRRGHHCLDEGRSFYGKDRIDIANILLASLYQAGLKAVDMKLLVELVREHVTFDTSCLRGLWEQANLYENGTMRRAEKKDLKGILDEFHSALFDL